MRYISKYLNPEATYEEMLLNIPDKLIENCDKNLKSLFSKMLTILDSTKNDDYSDWFLIRNDDNDIPPRAGYYLGYLIIKEVHKSIEINDIIKM